MPTKVGTYRKRCTVGDTKRVYVARSSGEVIIGRSPPKGQTRLEKSGERFPMNPLKSSQLLDILIENALRILAAGFGVNSAEASFFEVVRILREEPGLRSVFVSKVRSALSLRSPERLDSGSLPIELIELVAHEMRWPELLQIADDRMQSFFSGDRALAVSDIASRIPAAFRDDWEDREFYRHYGAGGQDSPLS